ncbi:MAG TPA: hypothetical protein VGC66_20710 [Pyrinomonadaceae bacterium]|jgi:hypothetical protein
MSDASPQTDFKEPREIIPLPTPVLEMMASREHRLLHAVWHGTRNLWVRLKEEQRIAIKDLGWAPPRASTTASAPIISNGSGEDFLFMHRQMIIMVNETAKKAGAQPIEAWTVIPMPDSYTNVDGFAIPPAWIDPDDQLTNRRIAALKTDEYYWSRMRWWDREFKNPQYLRQLRLGELGSLLEYTIHNDMHMRWASAPRDPSTGAVVPAGRPQWEISTKWDNPLYDFLGEFYSSHVNPVFWRLHGWIDARINDWYDAHQASHPGEIEKMTLDGTPWFKKGKWVMTNDPWAGAKQHNGHHQHGMNMPAMPMNQDVGKMEKVNAILFPPPPPDGSKTADFASESLLVNQTSRKLTWF